MALITHTVTLRTEYPGGDPLEGVWSTSVYAFPPLVKDLDGHAVIAGKDPEPTTDGVLVLELEATGQPDLDPADFRWQIAFTSKDRNTKLGPYVFELTGDRTLDDIAESSGVPITSAILDQAVAARDAAQLAEAEAEAAEAAAALSAAAAEAAALAAGDPIARTTRPSHAPALGLWFPEAEGATPGNSAVNNAAAINAAILACSTAGGGKVALGIGAYWATKIESQPNVELTGIGWQSVVKLKSAITEGVVNIRHSSFRMSNMTVDGNRSNVAGDIYGILKPVGSSVYDVSLNRVWVKSTGYVGIAFLGPGDRSVLSKRIKVRDCFTSDTRGHGMIAQNAIDDITWDNCRVETYGLGLTDCPGITTGRNSYDNKVINCTVDGAGSLVVSHGISMDTCLSGWVCANNTVKNAASYGIELGYCMEGTCTGNTVTDCGNIGIAITGNAGDAMLTALGRSMMPGGLTITGNTVRRCAAGIMTNVGSPQADSAIPAWKIWGQTTAYALNDRIVFKDRLYEATTAGTSGATVPVTLGNTLRANTVTDGTVTWTDRGPIISGLTITGNVLEDNINAGLLLQFCYNFTITGNDCARNGKSGVYIDNSSNIGIVSGNNLTGNCLTDITGANAEIRIVTLAATKQKKVKVGRNNVMPRIASLTLIATEGATNITGRFPAGDTTPSVAYGDTFWTANTGATSITTFDDVGDDGLGRIISVRVEDANTTFVHSASLDMSGDTNYTPPANTNLLFAYNHGQWREVSRSAA